MKCKFSVELSLSLWLYGELHGWALYTGWSLLVMTTAVMWPRPDSLRLSWSLDKRSPPQTHMHRALLPTSLNPWSLAAWILSQDPFHTIYSLYPLSLSIFLLQRAQKESKKEEKKMLLLCSFGVAGTTWSIFGHWHYSNYVASVWHQNWIKN